MPSATTAYVAEQAEIMERLRMLGRRIVGLNVSQHSLRGASDVAAVLDALGDGLRQFARRYDAAFVMIPHDRRRRNLGARGGSDAELLKALGSRVGDSVPMVAVDSAIRPDEAKAIVDLCDFVVTGRMHLAVAALGSRVMPLALSYADKFEGLYRHFGFDSSELAVSVNNAHSVGLLVELMAEHVNAQGKRETQLGSRLVAVRHLASANLAGVIEPTRRAVQSAGARSMS
jgi:polysaccharide pyruvyl transferase WcaK-like protein